MGTDSKKENLRNFYKKSTKKSTKTSNSSLIKELLFLKFLEIQPNIFTKLNVQITFLPKSIRIESFMKNIDFEDNVNFIEYSFKDYFLNVKNQKFFHKEFLKSILF